MNLTLTELLASISQWPHEDTWRLNNLKPVYFLSSSVNLCEGLQRRRCRRTAFMPPAVRYGNNITCAYMSDWRLDTFVTPAWSSWEFPWKELRWNKFRLSSYFVFLLLSCAARRLKPNRNGNRRTERSFQAPWPIIRMGCGFGAELNKVSVKRGCDIQLSKQHADEEVKRSDCGDGPGGYYEMVGVRQQQTGALCDAWWLIFAKLSNGQVLLLTWSSQSEW